MSFKCNFCTTSVKRVKTEDPSQNQPVPYCPSICCRTRKERDEEVAGRLNNRIYFNGITAHGYQRPIREAINPRFPDERTGGPSVEDFQPHPDADGKVDHERLSENFRYIDIYLGLVDGKNYGQLNRLKYQKIRHKRNKYGTEQRFCVPIVSSFDYGWWTRDLEELNKTKWYATRQRFPAVRGEVTKFVDDMAIHDPNFLFF